MTEQTCEAGGPITASVERLRRELDRWLVFALDQGERAIDAIRPPDGGHWMPAIDVIEAETEILVAVDLPGIDPKTVDVSLAGNMLTIAGERAVATVGAGQTVHAAERPDGAYSRSIPMPAAVDSEAVRAESHNGVLQIRLDKVPQARAHKIPVNTPAGTTSSAASSN